MTGLAGLADSDNPLDLLAGLGDLGDLDMGKFVDEAFNVRIIHKSCMYMHVCVFLYLTFCHVQFLFLFHLPNQSPNSHIPPRPPTNSLLRSRP